MYLCQLLSDPSDDPADASVNQGSSCSKIAIKCAFNGHLGGNNNKTSHKRALTHINIQMFLELSMYIYLYILIQ